MINDRILTKATDAMIVDLKHGGSHGARIRWGTSPDNFNLDGHVDLRSLAHAALTAALEPVSDPYKLPSDPAVKDSLTTADTTQEKT